MTGSPCKSFLLVCVLLLVLLPAVFLLVPAAPAAPPRGRTVAGHAGSTSTCSRAAQLNEAAVESAKARFRDLLERGEVEAVEASLRAGDALRRPGPRPGRARHRRRRPHPRTAAAAPADRRPDRTGVVLDRPGQRPARAQPLAEPAAPAALRRAGRREPLGHFFAAETVCFLGFAGYLRQPTASLGRAALRVLHRALEGCASACRRSVVAEARLGELVEALWDSRAEAADPLVGPHLSSRRCACCGARRTLEHALASEPAEQRGVRVADVAPGGAGAGPGRLPARGAGAPLCRLLAAAAGRGAARPAAGPERPAGRGGRRGAAAAASSRATRTSDLALEVLAWSQRPARRALAARVGAAEGAAGAPRPGPPPRRPAAAAVGRRRVPYAAILRALRGHPSPQTEAVLLLAARDWDPTYRAAAVGSLGWWEPIQRPDVLLTLQEARRDPQRRKCARRPAAALARLGERQALQWFRQTLTERGRPPRRRDDPGWSPTRA